MDVRTVHQSLSKNMLPPLLVLSQRPRCKDCHSDEACHHPGNQDAKVATQVVLGAEDDRPCALDLIPLVSDLVLHDIDLERYRGRSVK